MKLTSLIWCLVAIIITYTEVNVDANEVIDKIEQDLEQVLDNLKYTINDLGYDPLALPNQEFGFSKKHWVIIIIIL